MAPHSSTLAWKIPWTEEPGRLQSMGSLSWTRLSDFTFTFHFHALKKEMATHSSVLSWRIPGMGEPGVLPSMGSQSRTWLKRISSSSSSQSYSASHVHSHRNHSKSSCLHSPLHLTELGGSFCHDMACPLLLRSLSITAIFSMTIWPVDLSYLNNNKPTF